MIVTFSVQNFLSIRNMISLDFRATSDKTLEEFYVFELKKPKLRILKMAMIYGLNASGKTNLILALDFLRDFVLEDTSNNEHEIKVIPFVLDAGKPTTFDLDFIHEDTLYHYEVELNEKYILKEMLSYYPKGKEAIIFKRNAIIGENISYVYNWIGAELSNEQRKELEITNRNQSIISMMVKKEFSGPIPNAREWFRNRLDPIVTPDTRLFPFNKKNYLVTSKSEIDYKKFFIEQMINADFQINDFRVTEAERELSDRERQLNKALSKVLEENGLSLPISDKVNETSLFFQHQTENGSYEIDVEYESLGTKRYFEFIGLLCELIFKNRIVPIDEIESSLHIDLLIHFIVTFLRNSKRGQLLFTSHNTALLNERDILRRDAIWITDRNPDGSTEISSVSDFKVRKEHAIDRVYRKGLLGGTPNLGSTIVDGDYEKTEE